MMRNRIPPPIIMGLAIAVAWAGKTYLPALNIPLEPLKPIAYIGWAAGAIMLIWAGVLFKVNDTTVNPFTPDKTSAIVDTGPFKISRNPMYLGMFLILLGWAILWASYASLPILIGFIAYITAFQIKPEEAALTAQFGDDYKGYMARVRRWV